MTSNPFLFISASVLISSALVSCGGDERITNIGTGAGEDSGPGVADDDVIADDDGADDDVTPTPTTRPSTTSPGPQVTPPATSDLGAPCGGDAECGGDLECMPPEADAFFGGGPANGMCTLPCMSDFDCLAVDSNGFCLPVNETEAYCVPACIPGDPLLGETKCAGRPDLACATFTADLQEFNFCVPMCGTDEDCPDGRFCDLSSGSCVDEPLEGDPIGTACDPLAEETDHCSTGLCLAFSEEFGMCSGVCQVGSIGCGSGDAMPEDPSEPICLPVFSDTGFGDLGQCLQRCNCDLDCLHPGAKCFMLGDTPEASIASIGTVGVCFDGAIADDPDVIADGLVIGIECEDGREPPTMSDAGPRDSGAGGTTASEAGMSTPLDSGPAAGGTDASSPLSTDGG